MPPGISIRPSPTVSFVEVFDPPLAIKRFHSALHLIGSESRHKQRQAESARLKFSRSRNVPIRGGETIEAREFVERLGGGGEGYARVRSVARSGSSEIFPCPIKCAENYFHRSSRFSLFLSFLLAARLSVLHVLQTSIDASVRSANRWIRFGSNASEATLRLYPRLARSILAS